MAVAMDFTVDQTLNVDADFTRQHVSLLLSDDPGIKGKGA